MNEEVDANEEEFQEPEDWTDSLKWRRQVEEAIRDLLASQLVLASAIAASVGVMEDKRTVRARFHSKLEKHPLVRQRKENASTKAILAEIEKALR